MQSPSALGDDKKLYHANPFPGLFSAGDLSDTKPSVNNNHRTSNAAGGTSYSANTFISSTKSKPAMPPPLPPASMPPRSSNNVGKPPS